MLTQDILSGSSVNELKMLSNLFRDGGIDSFNDIKKIVKPVNIDSKDLLVSVEIYDRFMNVYPQYEVCFLAFCDDCHSNPSSFRAGYKGVGRQMFKYKKHKDGYDNVYEVNYDVMCAFMDAKMYTWEADFLEFENRLRNPVLSYYELPRPRCSEDDGQLKILLDVILAMDDLENREVNVLVLGSSHPLSPESVCSYDVIPVMGFKGTVDLYDPYEINAQDEIDGVFFSYNRKEYDYKRVVDDYDIVLDDVWVDGKTHQDIDPDLNVFTCLNYTVKKFPKECYSQARNVYKQVFKTTSREERYVSRAIYYNYRSLPLGWCGACVELRYLLKKDYPASFYDFFLRSHKRNCVTKEYRHHVESRYVDLSQCSYYKFQKTILDLTFFRLQWDMDLKYLYPDKNYPIASSDLSVLRNTNIIASDFLCVKSRILLNAQQLVLVNLRRCKIHGVIACESCVCLHSGCDVCFSYENDIYMSSKKELPYFQSVPRKQTPVVNIVTKKTRQKNAYARKYNKITPNSKEKK